MIHRTTTTAKITWQLLQRKKILILLLCGKYYNFRTRSRDPLRPNQTDRRGPLIGNEWLMPLVDVDTFTPRPTG